MAYDIEAFPRFGRRPFFMCLSGRIRKKGKAASGRRADTGRTGSGISKENQMTKIVKTDKAPAAIGPYSQGVIAGGFLYTSGQIGRAHV